MPMFFVDSSELEGEVAYQRSDSDFCTVYQHRMEGSPEIFVTVVVDAFERFCEEQQQLVNRERQEALDRGEKAPRRATAAMRGMSPAKKGPLKGKCPSNKLDGDFLAWLDTGDNLKLLMQDVARQNQLFLEGKREVFVVKTAEIQKMREEARLAREAREEALRQEGRDQVLGEAKARASLDRKVEQARKPSDG